MNCNCADHHYLIEGKAYGGRRTFASDKATMMSTLTRLVGSLKGNLDQKLMRDSKTGYGDLKDDFRSSLFSILKQYQSGGIDAGALERTWRSTIKDHWEKAYTFGAGSVGNPFGQKLWGEDITWLKGAEAEEFGYLGKFVNDIINDNLKMDLEKRLGMYADTLDGVYHHGQVEGSPDYVRIWWVLREAKHCASCIKLAAESPYTKRGGKNPLPCVPRDGTSECMASKFTSIYSENGWVPIYKIKIGDLVLTHLGRFRPVIGTLNNLPPKDRRIENDVLVIHVKVDGRAKEITLPVTEDHNFFMMDGTWREANQLVPGDNVSILSSACKSCGKQMPLLYRHKKIGEKVYCDECCVVPAHVKTRALVESGEFKFLKNRGKTFEQIHGKEKARVIREKLSNKVGWSRGKTFDEIYGGDKATQLREKFSMLYKGKTIDELHGDKAPGIRRKISEASKKIPREKLFGGIDKAVQMTIERNRANKGKAYEEIYGSKSLDIKTRITSKLINAGVYKRSTIELFMENVLKDIGIEFKAQYQMGPYIVDFFLPKQRIAIECDGSYWHNTPGAADRDRKKDEYLRGIGLDVIRFGEQEIRHNLESCKDRIERIMANHEGKYSTLPGIVTHIVRRKPIRGSIKYDLTVAEDHSYVAKGFVVHNCLSKCQCFLRFDLKEKPEPEPELGLKIKPLGPPKIPEGLRLPTLKEYDRVSQMWTEMDRLAGLINASTGKAKQEYLQTRRELSREIRDYEKKKKIYYVPGSNYIQEKKPVSLKTVAKALKPEVIPPEGFRLPVEKEKARIDKMSFEIMALRGLIVKAATNQEKKGLIMKKYNLNQDLIGYMEKRKIYYLPAELGIDVDLAALGMEAGELMA